MTKRLFLLLGMLCVVALTSYLAPYQVSTAVFTTLAPDTPQNRALAHPLYSWIPRHRSQIASYDVGRWTLWAIFGNDDDGLFGEEPKAHFRPEQPPTLAKALEWFQRNPLHNFCYYVIGSADRPNGALTLLRITPDEIRTCEYVPRTETVFAGNRSSLYVAFHGGKPFISFCLHWGNGKQSKFYLGWRCRGNFGIKCLFWTKQTKPVG